MIVSERVFYDLWMKAYPFMRCWERGESWLCFGAREVRIGDDIPDDQWARIEKEIEDEEWRRSGPLAEWAKELSEKLIRRNSGSSKEIN